MVRAILHEQEIREVIGVPGDGDLAVEGVAPLEAIEDRCLCFVNGEVTAELRDALGGRDGCIVIVPEGSPGVGALSTCRVLEVSDPRTAIGKVLSLVQTLRRQPAWVDVHDIAPRASISPLAVVQEPVAIAEDVRIEPFCVVGPEVSIGRGTVLQAGVRIHPRVSIGENSSIGANAVIGHPGYGFVRDEAGNKTRLTHLAGVLVGSHVEIGPTARIQGGLLRPTTIEDHAKLESVGLGHGVHVGRGVSILGGVVLGGSAEIGADAWLGMNASIRNGCRVGARALVGMGVSVQDDLPDDAIARAPRPDVRVRSPDNGPAGSGVADSRAR